MILETAKGLFCSTCGAKQEQKNKFRRFRERHENCIPRDFKPTSTKSVDYDDKQEILQILRKKE